MKGILKELTAGVKSLLLLCIVKGTENGKRYIDNSQASKIEVSQKCDN